MLRQAETTIVYDMTVTNTPLPSSGVVYCITFANTTASKVDLTCTNAAGTVNTLVVTVPANSSHTVHYPRLYIAGFKLPISVGVWATVSQNSPAGAL